MRDPQVNSRQTSRRKTKDEAPRPRRANVDRLGCTEPAASTTGRKRPAAKRHPSAARNKRICNCRRSASVSPISCPVERKKELSYTTIETWKNIWLAHLASGQQSLRVGRNTCRRGCGRQLRPQATVVHGLVGERMLRRLPAILGPVNWVY